MATGVSTQGSPFRPPGASTPSFWFSSSSRRSLPGNPWPASHRRPISGRRRWEFCPFRRLDACYSRNAFRGSMVPLQHSGTSARSIVQRNGMRDHSSLARSDDKSIWGEAAAEVRRAKMAQKVFQEIGCGFIRLRTPERVPVESEGFPVERASQSVNHSYGGNFHTERCATSTLPPTRNNFINASLKLNECDKMDVSRQYESSTSQALREGIQPNRNQLQKTAGEICDINNSSSMTTVTKSIQLDAPLLPKLPADDIEEPLPHLIGARPDTSTLSITSHDKPFSIKQDFKTSVGQTSPTKEQDVHKKLACIYNKVLVVDDISKAKKVVQMLTTKYRNFVHACDTEVANIDVKQDTPVGHGEIICFSIYSGSQADFGNGKSCIWVDVLDGGRSILSEFAPFFEDPSIKKVWHNYSFDNHVIENYGIKLCGFHADTMHLARLWDSSRRADGGYSLEALTSDPRVMRQKKSKSCPVDELIGKMSMKSIFGKKKLKKDGSEGKLITVAPVGKLQREERIPWICYSALDSISTLKLYDCLKTKLMDMPWDLDGVRVQKGSLYDFYEEYWRPFGALLVKMESEGMLVDRTHLSQIEKVAIAEQQAAAGRFKKWASKYCPDAKYMNVGSDTQIRQLFFGGIQNRKDQNETLPASKTFKVPNTENVIEEGKKTPSKYRSITLHRLCDSPMETEMYTASGWPSVSGDALKTFAGKVSTDQIYLMDDEQEQGESEKSDASFDRIDRSAYGTAYHAFGKGKKGRDACHAIAALCEVCSIDSLISNFILPLQGSHISCKNGRVHCSLNINTETGRLSARRPNLQNQPALEKDRYKIRQAFVAEPGNSLIVADYGQLELRILAHLADCKSMLEGFKAGGDFHSRTAINMYKHVREAVEENRVLLEWHAQPGEDNPPVPLLKDAFAAERRKAKMLNFSIAYGKTPVGLSRDWKVSVREAKETVKLWYKDRPEVLDWQEERKTEAREHGFVSTLLGRSRRFPSMAQASNAQKSHIERAAINTPVQGSAADVAMCAMLEIDRSTRLRELGWRLLLQVHDEVILEGPTESAELAKAIVVECMSKPFYGTNWLKVDLAVDAKCAQSWYAAK